MLLGASELCKMRVSLAVVRQSCFLTLVAAHLEAAVPCEQELGAPPVIGCGFTTVVATESPPSKEEPTLIFFVNLSEG
jgi:hypothetical protein